MQTAGAESDRVFAVEVGGISTTAAITGVQDVEQCHFTMLHVSCLFCCFLMQGVSVLFFVIRVECRRLDLTSLCVCVLRLSCCCLTRWQVVSVLFFVISELAGVEPMYQYSLAWFVGLFEATLVQAEKAWDLAKRIENLTAHFQYSLYLQVSRV